MTTKKTAGKSEEENAPLDPAKLKDMNIYQRLIEIRKACHYLQKNAGDVETGMKYKYVSSSQTLEAFRLAMDKYNVLFIPRIIKHEVRLEVREKWYNGAMTGKTFERLTDLEVEYQIIAADNPDESIKIPWAAQGVDTQEKGLGKALTYGEKYIFMKLFNVATDKDDPDNHQLDDGGENNKQGENNTQNQNEPYRYITDDQVKKLQAKLGNIGITERKNKLIALSRILKRDVDSSKNVGEDEANDAITYLSDTRNVANLKDLISDGKTATPKLTEKQQLCHDITEKRTASNLDGSAFITLTGKITGKTTVDLDKFTAADLHKISDTLDDPATIERLLAGVNDTAGADDDLPF